jgi:hypothetical protein
MLSSTETLARVGFRKPMFGDTVLDRLNLKLNPKYIV